MKSLVVTARYLPLLLLLACLGLPACGTSSTLYVTKGLSVELDQFETASVVARGNGVKLSKAADKFRKILSQKLEDKGLFGHVGPNGDVIIQAVIQNMDEGKEVGRDLTLSGEAEVTIEIKITKPDGAPLAHLTATAESPSKGDDDRPDLRVLRAAADEVVKYVEKHKGSKQEGKQKKKKSG